MSLFPLTRPTGRACPVLVEVPHAGLEIPDEVASQVEWTEKGLVRASDTYVDRLFSRAPEFGATLLCTRVSRVVVDLNRSADDIDKRAVPNHPAARATRGVVWHKATDGSPILKTPLSNEQFEHRIARYHTPYHSVLKQELHRIRETFGYAILVAGHSMPSFSKPRFPDPPKHRADIVPGTRGRTTAGAPVIDAVEEHFSEAGFEVRHDVPYRGGWTTAQNGQPHEGVHAIQIELNRRVYLDEWSCEVKQAEFDRLRDVLGGLIERLGRLQLA